MLNLQQWNKEISMLYPRGIFMKYFIILLEFRPGLIPVYTVNFSACNLRPSRLKKISLKIYCIATYNKTAQLRVMTHYIESFVFAGCYMNS